MANLPELTVILASPRGFCAGVTRAVQIVSKALKKFGTPVYVRHEIVHNKFVVQNLANKGAIFVNELDEPSSFFRRTEFPFPLSKKPNGAI